MLYYIYSYIFLIHTISIMVEMPFWRYGPGLWKSGYRLQSSRSVSRLQSRGVEKLPINIKLLLDHSVPQNYHPITVWT